jgi:hypothetical protein
MTSDRREMIKEFREWRESEGLDFNPSFVPRRFADIKGLDDGYWQNEQAAKREAVACRTPPAPRSPNFVTQRQLDRMLEVIGKWCGQQIAEALKDAIAPLQERIRELEALPMKFAGPWQEGMEYQARSIVSYDGSMWHANEKTRARPGRTGAWTLCVKRGRDSRDRSPKREEPNDDPVSHGA